MPFTRLHKSEAVALFGSAKALARALGISKAAVSQWPEGPIPQKQDLKIRYELKAEHFRVRAQGRRQAMTEERGT